jgi:hemolysin D
MPHSHLQHNPFELSLPADDPALFEPVEPVEPVEPIEPVEPVKPVEPSEPIEPESPDPPLDWNDAAEDWSSITQETLNTLPKVWTRGLLYLLIGLTAIVLPWAMLSRVDEVDVAKGRLEPKGKTIRLDAAVSGTVARMRVKEGQTVQAGQSLMELESTVIVNDLEQAQAKQEGQVNRLNQLSVLQTQLQMTTRTQQQQSRAQAAEQSAEMARIEERLVANESAIAAAQAILEKDQERVARFQALREQGVISGAQVEDAERSRIENNQKWQQSQAELQESRAELQKQKSALQRVLREGDLAVIDNEKQSQELATQISDLKAEIAQSQKQIQSLQYQWQQRILYAPVDGIIFQLPIQNPGAVVQPGTLIAQIAPRGAPMILRSQISSQDMGFLKVGLPVKVKFDAYPFQDYGVIAGRLSWISPDSKLVQVGQRQQEMFELEVELAQSYVQAGNKQIVLTPGLTATAEVVVRQRRVIDFFTDPFKQLQKGGVNF